MNHALRPALLVALLGLQACGAMPDLPRPDDPAYAPISPAQLQPARQLNGAIFQLPQIDYYNRVSLFEDRKAHQIGDILTVNLIERTTATKETETEIKKESSVSIPEPTIFQRVTNFGLQTEIDSNRGFKGQADSDQRNSLQGSISVTVTDIYANGVLMVRGEKWITLNRGDEYIRISGLVRPDDIKPDNSVDSSKVADARITYSQTGELAHANSMGWLARFFNSPLWPF